MKRTRRTHAAAFKAKVVLAAIKGDKTLHAKIGQLSLENDFLESALIKAGMPSAR